MLPQKYFSIPWSKVIFLGCLMAAVFWPPLQSSAQDDGKNILILNSYHPGFDWSDKEIEGIQAVLPPDVNLVVEYMDTKRLADNDYFNTLFEIYKRKYQHETFDSIVTLDDNAFDFTLKFGDRLFPHTPIVFGGVNHFDDTMIAGHDQVTGVVENINHSGTLDIALKLHPDTQKLLIITDQTTTGQIHRAYLEQLNQDRQFPVEFVFLDQGEGLDLPQLLEIVKNAPPDSIVYYSDFFRDKHGNFINYKEVLPILSKASTVPIYNTEDFYLTYGTVGGKLTSGYYEGEVVGKMVARILDGEPASAIPIERKGITKYMFDYEQLDRWNIPLSELPEGSFVVNTPDTFYATPSAFYYLNKQYIWGGIAFIVGQTLIIAYLIINFIRRRNAEKALKQYSARLQEMVDERTQELREAQEQLVQQERLATLGQLAGNLAHELHNPLGAIRNTTYFLDMALENPDDDVKESLKILNQEIITSEHIISSLLEFSHPEPAIRRRLDINELLQQVIAAATLPHNIEVITHLEPSLPPVQADPQQLEVVFENLIRNSVQAMQFTKARKGQLIIKSIRLGDDSLAVFIKDTGVGISSENLPKLFEPLFTTKAKGIGLGLALSKLLVEENGGIIKVQSDGIPGQGSTFTIQLPLAKPKQHPN